MRFSSPTEFRDWPQRAVTVFGMSGTGKTWISEQLRLDHWFHYSVDYRIGTRYMGEHIVDSYKRAAMELPLLRQLLRSDSIFISSNIRFNNLAPLSTYLGKPGNLALGGIEFDEYVRRQAQHRDGETRALLDVPDFIAKAHEIYGYDHFICDSGGSLAEVVDPDDKDDPVLSVLNAHTIMLYVEGNAEHERLLVERFRESPKPMYYEPAFLEQKWAEFQAIHGISNGDEVDPDAFAVWGFEALIRYRMPIYEKIASRYGYRIRADDLASIKNTADFCELVCDAIARH